MTYGQEFKKGDTIRLKATFKDFSGTLVDPSAMSLKVYNSAGTAVLTKALADLAKQSTGIYYYDWATATATVGDYIYEFSGTLASGAVIDWDYFAVVYH